MVIFRKGVNWGAQELSPSDLPPQRQPEDGRVPAQRGLRGCMPKACFCLSRRSFLRWSIFSMALRLV